MRSQLRTTTTAATAALVLLALLAPSAHAGTLLSGYGGPGQGNQAILGAALLNGPGGGEGGGGTAGSGGSAGSSGPATPATGIAAGEGRSSSSGGSSAGGSGKGAGGGDGGAAKARSQEGGRAAVRTAPEASVGSQPLGISGAELLYILLGLGALAVTGVLTRQLTRRP